MVGVVDGWVVIVGLVFVVWYVFVVEVYVVCML